MVDLSRDTVEHARTRPHRKSSIRPPRWVKVSAFIAGVLIWAFVLMPFVLMPILFGFGTLGSSSNHGPGTKAPGVTRQQETSPANDGHVPPPGIPDHGKQQP